MPTQIGSCLSTCLWSKGHLIGLLWQPRQIETHAVLEPVELACDLNLHVPSVSSRFRLLQSWADKEPRLPHPSAATAAAAAAASRRGGGSTVHRTGGSRPQSRLLARRRVRRGHGAGGGPVSRSRPAAHVDARPEVRAELLSDQPRQLGPLPHRHGARQEVWARQRWVQSTLETTVLFSR